MWIRPKVKQYTCRICGQPGLGSFNARVHPGKCRQIWQTKLNQRTYARKKEARDKARELVAA